MARHNYSLTTTQARTALYLVNRSTVSLFNRKEIETEGLTIVESLENTFPVYFNSENHFSVVAFVFSSLAQKAIKDGSLSVLEYISILAEVKEENETEKKDFGAFGDLYEILVRCAFMKKLAFVNWSTLTVREVKENDIISKKYGKIEVGHNGKSLTFGSLFDFMDGDYTSFVYGVFAQEDKAEVYNLCKEQKYYEAIDYVSTYSVYWANKYDFQNDMDNLTRGKGITVKGENIQVQYNPGKYTAFLMAIEDGKFTSLKDTL